MNEIKNLKVNTNNPFFTAAKWNETLDYSINFENILTSIIGENFKGIYKPNKHYELYDYVWTNNDCYQVLGDMNIPPSIVNSNGYSNFYSYSNGKLALNNNGNLVNINSVGEEKIIFNIQLDMFCYHESGPIMFGVKNNRILKLNINDGTSELMNVIFDKKIDKILCDEYSLFILSEDSVLKADNLNIDNTSFTEIYSLNKIYDFSISDTKIFILGNSSSIEVFDRGTHEKISDINIIESVGTKAKVVSIDDNSLYLYDGRTNITSYYNNGNGIYVIENTLLTYDEWSKGISSITYSYNYMTITGENNTVSSVIANRYILEKVPLKIVTTKNSNIDISNLIFKRISYVNGQFSDGNFFHDDEKSSLEIVHSVPSITSSFSLYYDIDSSLYKGLIIEIKSASSSNKSMIGNIYKDYRKYSIPMIGNNNDNLCIFVEFNESEAIVTYKNKKTNKREDIKITGEASNINNFIELKATDNWYLLNEIILLNNKLKEYEKDYINNNYIKYNNLIQTQIFPAMSATTDINGNLPIKLKNNSIKIDSSGLSNNISDDAHSNDSFISFSTAGANAMKIALEKNMKEGFEAAANKQHTHIWKQINEVPTATTENKGITILANSLSDSTITAITPNAVKKAFEEYKHPHPYLNVNTGGKVNGTVEANGIKTEVFEISGYKITIG